MEVKIPFLTFFQSSMVLGQKTCTSRNKKYGDMGDRFWAFGCYFELTHVEKRTLSYVKIFLWRDEGCKSPSEFKDIWEKLHPKIGFKGEHRVWVHHFKLLPKEMWS